VFRLDSTVVGVPSVGGSANRVFHKNERLSGESSAVDQL
jgi:hypothetical protein